PERTPTEFPPGLPLSAVFSSLLSLQPSLFLPSRIFSRCAAAASQGASPQPPSQPHHRGRFPGHTADRAPPHPFPCGGALLQSAPAVYSVLQFSPHPSSRTIRISLITGICTGLFQVSGP